MSGQGTTQRQVLLDYLAEARRTPEIAEIIGRSVSHAAGVLAALVQRGTVVRLQRGVYQRADRVKHVATKQEPAVKAAILQYCSSERTVAQIARETKRSARRLRTVLNEMVREGRLERVGQDGYRPPQPSLLVWAARREADTSV